MSPNNAGADKSKAVIPAEGKIPRGLARPSVSTLLGDLLCDIYGGMDTKKLRTGNGNGSGDTTRYTLREGRSCSGGANGCGLERNDMPTLRWMSKDVDSLKSIKQKLEKRIVDEGKQLVKHLRKKNFLLMKREAHCDLITAYIQALSTKTREDTRMKFSLSPGAETGFSQWLDAMKMVAQLPDGMPPEFRTKLWLQLSEKHLTDLNVDWEKAEGLIFNEWTNPDDEELGVQIVKDLHRTGCSLFCGEQEHNQAVLKRVLLAYARWNKNVGYCQGFNMLAALILQVMDKNEKNAVKVMIYLIEGVLPESYFANNLRGLSVDMAVFRDLLRLRLPKLSKHLEALQHDTNSGTSYEPPLTNVFTMQWFLTLFSNCLPQQTVLRVWDLVFLYGNEVLLRTALAIWSILQDRVISVESADEFYSIMGVVTREMLEFGLMDANTLVKMIAKVDPFPNELQELRDRYLYNISPWTQSVQSAARKSIKLFYNDADDQEDTEDEDKIALTTAYGVFRRRESAGRELQVSGPTLDISILKQQYAKLRQRQRQAHVIITAACASNLSGHITAGPSVSVNHLLMGKSALVNKGRRIGPPEGSIPPSVGRKGQSEDKKKTPDACKYRGHETLGFATDNNPLINEKNIGKGKEVNRELQIIRHSPPIGAGKYEEEKIRRRKMSSSSSSSSSTSTELCDEIWRVGSDSEDVDDDSRLELSSKRLSIDRQASLRSQTHLESQSDGKVVCDNRDLLDIRMVANMLLDDIEERVRTSDNLQNSNRVKTDKRKVPETSGVRRVDNTIVETVIFHQGKTDNFSICFDNTLKLKPEVPKEDNVIVEGTASQERQCKKSDLGMNIIRENLKVLHKYSALRAAEKEVVQVDVPPVSYVSRESEREFTRMDDKMEGKQVVLNSEDEDEDEEMNSGVDKSDVKMNSAASGKRGGVGDVNVTPPRSNVRLEKGNSSNVSPAKVEKVNKEVNTEISFGSESDGFSEPAKSSLKDPKEVSGEAGSLARRRMFDGGHVDEMKTRIEISKTDWDLKMRKIAELETTTRETLTEMQSLGTSRRKWSRHAADSSSVRAAGVAFDSGHPNASSLAVPRAQGTRDSAWRPQLSFDAVTSRTEKLLGNVEFSRSTDDSFSSCCSSREFEYREPKRSVSDMKSRPEADGVLDRIRGAVGTGFGAERRPPIADGKDRPPAPFRSLEGEPEFRGSDKSPFNPFPTRSLPRPKNLGMRLGLYHSSLEEQPKKS